MSAQILHIHPDNPQPRLVSQVVAALREGAVIAYPTDSSYALGCALGEKSAIERIAAIRGFDKEHYFTLLCRDLSDIAIYAKIENSSFRLLKTLTPGPYTFVLPATREVPRWVWHPKRKTIGIRVPEHNTAAAIAQAQGGAVMSVTALLPGSDIPLSEADDLFDRIGNQVDLIVDSGACNIEPTTVLDMTEDAPKLVRQGRGPVDHLGL